MRGSVLVSDGAGMVCSYAPIDLVEVDRVRLAGKVGLIYAKNNRVYLSVDDGILRLRTDDLQPEAQLRAGEDAERIALSHDMKKLYVLLSGANTLLMMDADTGEWQTSARVGNNPRDLHIDRSGRYLAIAGGDSCSVCVLDADTLAKLAEYPLGGQAVGAVFSGDTLLMLSETGDWEPFSQVSAAFLNTGRVEKMFMIPNIPTCFTFAMNGMLIGHMNGITMVNLQHREVRWRINVNGLPDLVTPVGRLACYMDRLTGRVGVIDCFQPTLMTVMRKPEPMGLAVL